MKEGIVMRRARSFSVMGVMAAVALLFATTTAVAQEGQPEEEEQEPDISQEELDEPPGANATIALSQDTAHPGDMIEVAVTGCGTGLGPQPEAVGSIPPGYATISIGPPAWGLADGPLVEPDGTVTEIVQIPTDILTSMDPAERLEIYGFEPGMFEIAVHCARDVDAQPFEVVAPILIVEPELPTEPPPVVEPLQAAPQFTG